MTSSSVRQRHQSSNISQEKSVIEEKERKSNHQKEKMHFEFGGPVGAFFIVIGLPFVLYFLYFACSKDICLQNPFIFDYYKMIQSIEISNLISYEALRDCIMWIGFHILMERILPCEVVEGVELPNKEKTRLKYNISGHLQFWMTMLAMFHIIPVFKESPWTSWDIVGFAPLLPVYRIYDNYVGLVTVSIIVSALLSIYLYVSSFRPGRLLAAGGDTGYHIYDFFIGRELNPRIGSFDLKEFCELRPGLIGWLAINMGMATAQYRKRGSLSGSMVMIVLFQGLYVWDALFQEKAILTTMDITTDGFGYMLAFGDLSWVPFVYSFQARYLVDHDPNLSPTMLLLIVILHWFGFYVFRAANSQKDAFRRDPNSEEVRHLKYLATKRGTRLLLSGWWGLARKINYTGDFLVTLAWCMLCGVQSPLPYFQAVYFAILLVHRAIRDDEICHKKYGDDWLEYKKRVPYMFIPFVV